MLLLRPWLISLALAGPDWTREGDWAEDPAFGTRVVLLVDANGDGLADLVVGASNYADGYPSALVYHGVADCDWDEADQVLFDVGSRPADLGDVNGDGLSDLAVGAPGEASYIFLGTPDGFGDEPDFALYAPEDSDYWLGGVGDLNGDGYDEIGVGDGFGTTTGQVILYPGSSTGPSESAAITLSGDQVGSRFGRSLAGIGDLNGDGYGDLAVGAPSAGDGGGVYVYLGSSTGVADVSPETILGDEGYELGEAVAGPGDMDADGYDDLVAASPSDGLVQLYRGGVAAPSGSPDAEVENLRDEEHGGVLAPGGDVDGDGFADLLVGQSVEYYAQKGWIYRGGPHGLSDEWESVLVGEYLASFASTLDGGGDLDADGLGDVAIGAPGYGDGEVVLFLGHPAESDLSASVTIDTPAYGQEIGASSRLVSDVDGDGDDELLVGTPGSYHTEVYLGAEGGISWDPDQTLGEHCCHAIGTTLASAGDLNGDGFGDAALGTTTNDCAFPVAYGGSAGLELDSALVTPSECGDRMGAIDGAGDLDADGYDDIILGAYNLRDDMGAFVVILGDAYGLGGGSSATYDGSSDQQLGSAVAGAGDVDGDGFDDVLVGASGDEDGLGSVLVYHGMTGGLEEDPTLRLLGPGDGSMLGSAVDGAGDVDGDGYDDLILGAYGYESRSGYAALHLGSVEGVEDEPAATTLGSEVEGHELPHLGYAVSGLGDMDADGYDDLAISAPALDADDPGEVRLFLGGAEPSLASPLLVLAGGEARYAFGDSLDGGRDVDADGLPDLLVGSGQGGPKVRYVDLFLSASYPWEGPWDVEREDTGDGGSGDGGSGDGGAGGGGPGGGDPGGGGSSWGDWIAVGSESAETAIAESAPPDTDLGDEGEDDADKVGRGCATTPASSGLALALLLASTAASRRRLSAR